MSIRLWSFFAIAVFSHLALGSPCPSVNCENLDQCKAQANWVVEGTIAEIVGKGAYKDCDLMGDGTLLCGQVDKPESLFLTDLKIIRGSLVPDGTGKAMVSRAAQCFSGILSIMNGKPELKEKGRRMRFYGGSFQGSAGIGPGYVLVESAE